MKCVKVGFLSDQGAKYIFSQYCILSLEKKKKHADLPQRSMSSRVLKCIQVLVDNMI